MKLIKEVAGRIFAVWALLVFVITMLPVVIYMWIIGIVNEPSRTEMFRVVSHVWMRIFFFFTGCPLRITGKEHFKKGVNYIVISNHNSLMDVPLTTPFIPGANKTIAKVEMSKVPLFGLIYKRGSVLVDRKDKNSRKDSFGKMKAVLQAGMHMCIYPEGTRNKTNEPLKEFHDGAFKLAIETGKSIIPTLLLNTNRVLPYDKGFFFWPSRLEIHFYPERIIEETDTYDTLKTELHHLMKTEYQQLSSAK